MRNERLLTKTMFIILALWVIAQIVVMALFWDKQQGSDQGEYIKMALYCFQHNEWYPMKIDTYSDYIWAPGFVNFLILQLKLFGTLHLNMVFNLLMNVAITIEIYYLSKQFFNKRASILSVIIWCLLYSNLMIVAPAGTEIPFLFLSLTAFCFCLTPRSYLFLIAGVLFALANWVRPFAIVFILVALMFMFWKRYKLINYINLAVSFFIIVFLIGKSTQNKIGYFVFQSSVSGVNLIQTANDKAYGGVATSLFIDTTSIAYIQNASSYTFLQKDSIWKMRAIEWIKQNPFKFAKLYFIKFAGLYSEDSWPDRPLLGGAAFVNKYIVDNKMSSSVFWKEMFNRGLKSIVYYFVLIAFFYSIIINRKSLFSEKGIILMVLVIGTFITNIFPVSPRYHYSFLFVIVLFAAYGIDTFLTNAKDNTDKIKTAGGK
jgi:hypothetical protein